MTISVNMIYCLFMAALLGCATPLPEISMANSLSMGHVVKREGVYASPNGKCEASLTINELGGFLSLTIRRKGDERDSCLVDDITGIVWISENELIYTVSPIYGQPGVFLYDCNLFETKRIVGPRTINTAYPDGADYFELQSFSPDSSGRILFYYSPDVDLVDFGEFRKPNFLYQVCLDGTRFRKAELKKEK